MSGAIPPLPEYVFMAWCLVKRRYIGDPEGKRPLGRPRRRWEDNISIDVREIMWKTVEWMHMA
jgi:hypothetical protein